MAWYNAARMEILRDRSLTKEQKAGRRAALKTQRKIMKDGLKANKKATKLQPMKVIKPRSAQDPKPLSS
jgi:hypothetical protein